MSQPLNHWSYYLNLISYLACGTSVFLVAPALAQSNPVPDNSLGAENSQIIPNQTIDGLSVDIIDGGAVRGSHLFHSFIEFNVEQGRGAYFSNRIGIENIFSRVTGANSSAIDGTLGVLGDANLFLLNPNGIIFGPNSRLDVGGSFFASTADSVLFNEYEFDTVNPTAPPLLTMSQPVGLQVGQNPGDIVIRSQPISFTAGNITEVADAGPLLDTAQVANDAGSSVPSTITGELAENNDVDLYRLLLPAGSSFSASTVGGTDVDTIVFLFDENGLGIIGNDDGVGLQSTLPAQEVTASGEFYLGLSSFNNRPISAGGDIFSLNDFRPTGPGSVLPLAGYTDNGQESGAYTIFLDVLSSDPNDVGGLQVPAGETLTLLGGDVRLESGQILAPGVDVQLGGLNAAGVITLDANQRIAFPENVVRGDVLFEAGATVNVQGDGDGSVAILADTLSLTQASEIVAGIRADATSGNGAGDIVINASNLVELLDGTRIEASTFGLGNAGQIVVNTGTFRAQGASSEVLRRSGGIFNNVEEDAVGNSGGIVVEASERVELLDGAGIFSEVGRNAEGNSGGIVLEASDSVELLNKAGLEANTAGQGNAGPIVVNTTIFRAQDSDVVSEVEPFAEGNSGGIVLEASESVELLDGTLILSNTSGQGNAGPIEVNTTTFRAQGTGSFGVPSTVFSEVRSLAVGNSGGIVLEASESVELLDGAQLAASNSGQGNTGPIAINTNTFRAQGESSRGRSGVISEIEGFAEGNSGGIVLEASNSVELLDGGRLSTTIRDRGAGTVGSIVVDTNTFRAQGEASNGDNSGVFSFNFTFDEDERSSGKIELVASDSIELLDGAQLITNTLNQGNAGQIVVNTTTFRAQGASSNGDNSGVFSQVESSSISERSEGDSEGIILEASESIELLDRAGLAASTSALGNAGEITIATPNLSLADAAFMSTETTGAGNASSIRVEASEAVTLGQNTRLTAETSGAGAPGDIEITAPILTIGQNAELSTTITADSTNQAGNSDIKLNTSVLDISGELGVFAETNSAAPAGDLSIQPTSHDTDLNIQFRDNGFIAARTTATGIGGGIEITAPETINIQGQGRVSVETLGQGDAGQVTLTAPEVTLKEGITIAATTTASGQAGDILLDVADSLTIDNSTVESSTGPVSSGLGGNIFIGNEIVDQGGETVILQSTPEVALNNGGRITVNSEGQAQGGNITTTADQLTLNNGSAITATTRSSNGGNLTFTLEDVLVLRNGSTLSATAGTAQAGGDGGNISITGPNSFLVAVPDENSDITANAFEGNGGNINITARNILGLEFRPKLTPLSDITASSEFGLSGTVTLNTPNLDPAQGLIELPTDLVDRSNQIDQRCLTDTGQGQSAFVVTGRGGLPPTPNDVVRSESPGLIDLEIYGNPNTLTQSTDTNAKPTALTPTTNRPTHLVEAQSFVMNDSGIVELLAQASQATAQLISYSGACPSRP
ncbi:filamentous hemagglutinin N-terminal domain-containing protein [Leptothoe sp. ISB3NOV94-8A]